MGREIQAEDITEYLDSRDDFDLELFAYRALKEHGWFATHGGTYVDPLLGKPRQYDIRARQEFSLKRHLALAVECKSLSAEFPLVVSRVPREPTESHHDVLVRQSGSVPFFIDRSDLTRLSLYGAGELVAKAATQIRWSDNGKKLTASDADTYDKWSQALASAAEFLKVAMQLPTDALVFVMPLLLVSDGSLWTVDYTEDGVRGCPAPADEALLFVDRQQTVPAWYGPTPYNMTHLHICTRKGFVRLLKNLSQPTGLMLERIFGQALRRAAQ
jgi:hypothetical protein